MENMLLKKFFDQRPYRNGGGRQLGQEDTYDNLWQMVSYCKNINDYSSNMIIFLGGVWLLQVCGDEGHKMW